MRLKQALHRSAALLAGGGIEDARLEAEVLLMHVMGIDRARLYACLQDELSPADERELSRLRQRRLCREPLAYITGRREFFGLEFCVAPAVLIPRPESELLVEQALDFASSHFSDGDPVIVDVGTGSGAIAIALALRLPQARVYATDISPQALEVAALNCRRHGVAVHLLHGDLLEPLPQAADIIVANLPYVAEDELPTLSLDITLYEPCLALAGGLDGLEPARRLLSSAPRRLRRGGVILLEMSPGQGPALSAWASGIFPSARMEVVHDLAGRPRVLRLSLPPRPVARECGARQ